MAEDDIRLRTNEHVDSFLDNRSPGPWEQQGYHSAAKVQEPAPNTGSDEHTWRSAKMSCRPQKENFPPTVDLESPVIGEHQYQLKSPGHIAKLQLARAAAAQHAHRWSATPPAATSSESKAFQAVSRRRAAAEWVEVLTGVALPTASDAALRGALRDGMLLCKLLNILRPGILPKVSFLSQDDTLLGFTKQCPKGTYLQDKTLG